MAVRPALDADPGRTAAPLWLRVGDRLLPAALPREDTQTAYTFAVVDKALRVLFLSSDRAEGPPRTRSVRILLRVSRRRARDPRLVQRPPLPADHAAACSCCMTCDDSGPASPRPTPARKRPTAGPRVSCEGPRHS